MILLNFAKSTHIKLEFVEIYVYITLHSAGIPKLGATISFTETLECTPLKFRDSESWIFFHLSLILIYYLFRGLVRLFKSFDRNVFFLFCEFAVQSRFNKKFSLLHQFFERYENLSQIKLYLATKQNTVGF